MADSDSGTPTDSIALPLIVALLLVLLSFLICELREPYYFSQDDNRMQFLPGLVLAGRTFFEEGGLALWNPYQFSGAPFIEVGVYAVWYPFTYLSYAVARYALGQELYTLEVLAALHLLIATLMTFAVLRKLSVSAWLCSFGASSFALSGYHFIVGRSWYYILPLAAWLPLGLLGILYLRDSRKTLCGSLLLSIALSLLIVGGNIQLAYYGAISIALSTGSLWRKRWASILKSGGLTCALTTLFSAPAILSQFQFVSGIERKRAVGEGTIRALMPWIFPYPLSQARHPLEWGNLETETMGAIYFNGGLPTLVAGFGALVFFRTKGAGFKQFFLPLLFCVLLGLGELTPVWTLLHPIQPLSTFNHPFKTIPLVHFYCAIISSLLLSGYLRSPHTHLAVFTTTAALLLYNVSLCRTSFYHYPGTPATYASSSGIESSGRLLSSYPLRSTSPEYASALPHNIPTLVGQLSAHGFDPLVQVSKEQLAAQRRIEVDPIAALREFGIDTYVHMTDEPRSKDRVARIYESWRNLPDSVSEKVRANWKALSVSPHMEIYESLDRRPMLFTSAGEQPATVEFTGRGLSASFERPFSGELTVNVLYRPNLEARGDGFLETRADSWGRTVVTVPELQEQISLRPRLPWLLIISVQAVCCLVLFALLAKVADD